MIRARILAIIAASPGISARELKEQLQIGTGALYNILTDLKRTHAIEPAGYGRYRVTAPRTATAGAGQIMPLAKLMAGR
jgi:predicted transcriptional regulator